MCEKRVDTMGERVKIQELDFTTQEHLASLFNGYKFARFGDAGYIMPVGYKEDADNCKNMAIRPDDVWVATFPRSGTTWTQELVWLVNTNCDYETALKIPLIDRYMFLELKHVFFIDEKNQREMDKELLQKLTGGIPSFEEIANAPSPRFMKTHLPFSLLPSNLLDTTKVVYVARDPRDVAVSYYYHSKLFIEYSGDFKTFWKLLMNDLVSWSPIFEHLKEAWALRHHPNMLLIFYEEMIMDLPSCIRRIATFFDKEVTNEQIVEMCDHLDIKNFRNNESVNPSFVNQVNPDAEGFVRKGKSGGWREVFDEETAAQAQRWMRENLAGTDLRFPDASSKVASSVSLYNK